MEQQLSDGTEPALEVIAPKPKGKKSRWLLVGVGLILLAFLSNGKQPSNGTNSPPKVTPAKQVPPPKPKGKIIIHGVLSPME